MKNKFSIAAYLLICATIIATAIYAGGTNHANCRECKLALSKGADESHKFASACEFGK